MAKKRASKKKAAAKKAAARPVGRPTKYNAEVQRQAEAYLAGAYKRCGDGVPSRVGLARYLNVVPQTLENWAEDNPQFLVTLQEIHAEQHRAALGGGISGKFNPTICKLVLANHGYSERFAQEHFSPDGSMTPGIVVVLPPKQ